MRRFLFIATLVCCALTGAAQQPPPERVIEVTGSVQQAIDAQVAEFNNGGRAEVLRLSDMLIYPFGLYQPVLTCTILRACVVELEEGEILISLIAGDDQRWLIDHTATGAKAGTPLVSVKPIDHNITTNLIISTDRRVYHITLDSPPGRGARSNYNPLGRYTRHIRFYYPEQRNAKLVQSGESREQPNGLTLNALNHNYTWRRERGFPWVPGAVFDDGERVYIRVPAAAFEKDQPLLTIGKKGTERVADYIVRDGFYIIDGLFAQARLVTSGPARWRPFRRPRQTQRALHVYAQAE